MERVAFHGTGMHSGKPCTLRLERAPGPVVFVRNGRSCTRDDLIVLRTDQGVKVEAPHLGLRVDLVEHLAAALAGLSLHAGVAIEVEGPEVPVLDGAALELATELSRLHATPTDPPLFIARSGSVAIGDSRYQFEPAADGVVQVEVTIEFDRGGIGRQTASWNGSRDRFLEDIAPARTFGFRNDEQELRARGRALHVDPRVVIVLAEDGSAVPPSRPPEAGELARHKLLDLLGDFYIYGGPPRGRIAATRPGHAATHAAIRRALEQGLLERRR